MVWCFFWVGYDKTKKSVMTTVKVIWYWLGSSSSCLVGNGNCNEFHLEATVGRRKKTWSLPASANTLRKEHYFSSVYMQINCECTASLRQTSESVEHGCIARLDHTTMRL